MTSFPLQVSYISKTREGELMYESDFVAAEIAAYTHTEEKTCTLLRGGAQNAQKRGIPYTLFTPGQEQVFISVGTNFKFALVQSIFLSARLQIHLWGHWHSSGNCATAEATQAQYRRVLMMSITA